MTDYNEKALRRAEQIGVYEYNVNGHLMEYLSFFGQNEGWYYIVYDLEADTEIYRDKAFPWLGFIPYWLKTETGATRYNYMEG